VNFVLYKIDKHFKLDSSPSESYKVNYPSDSAKGAYLAAPILEKLRDVFLKWRNWSPAISLAIQRPACPMGRGIG